MDYFNFKLCLIADINYFTECIDCKHSVMTDKQVTWMLHVWMKFAEKILTGTIKFQQSNAMVDAKSINRRYCFSSSSCKCIIGSNANKPKFINGDTVWSKFLASLHLCPSTASRVSRLNILLTVLCLVDKSMGIKLSHFLEFHYVCLKACCNKKCTLSTFYWNKNINTIVCKNSTKFLISIMKTKCIVDNNFVLVELS